MIDSAKEKSYESKKRAKEKLAFKTALKRKLKSFAVWGVVILMILFFGGGELVSIFMSRQNDSGSRSIRYSIAEKVEVYPEQGRDHIPDGKIFSDYNSNPPTSGPHWAEPAPWGIYDYEIPDERLVHNLEHCGIWISYQPDIAQIEKDKIAAFAKEFPSKVIVTPRSKNASPIAIAAWTRLLRLDSFSREDAEAFAALYLNKIGPECLAR